MSELGDLLELLHDSRESFGTFRGRYRLWSQSELAQEAFAASMDAAGERGHTVAMILGEGEEERASPVSEGEWRIWFQRPDRVREEVVGEGFGIPLGVRVGQRWWTFDEWSGATTNEGNEEVSANVGETFGGWFEPAAILGLLEFEALGSCEIAGRGALSARATRPAGGLSEDGLDSWSLHRLGAEAREYLLALDAERGVILRLEARHEGEPFFLAEALEVAFDEAFDDETFVFTPPAGEELRPVEIGDPGLNLSFDEAAARASCPVFLPARVPSDWRLSVTFVEARERPPSPSYLGLHYRSEDATASVQISQSPAGIEDEWDPVSESAPKSEQLVRDGLAMKVRGRTAEWPQSTLTMTREGTRIHLLSDDLGAEALVELAATLTPAREVPRH